MAVNKKNIITIILFTGLLLPFVSITDFFPFLRFGMFAEPIKKDIQTEQFIVYKTAPSGSKQIFNPEEIGINPNTFHYLCRNYYYRNEMELFADKLFIATRDTSCKLEIVKVITHHGSQQTDSLKINTFSYHE
jgi:hypothetical protein